MMSIKHFVTADGNLLIEIWDGKISPDKAIQNEKNILSNSSLNDKAVVLTDLRNAILTDITEETIKEITKLHENPDNPVSISKTIVISPDIDPFEKTDIYRKNTDESHEVIMVSSLKTAALLLNIDEKELENLIEINSSNK